jgi:hypothetical protein
MSRPYLQHIRSHRDAQVRWPRRMATKKGPKAPGNPTRPGGGPDQFGMDPYASVLAFALLRAVFSLTYANPSVVLSQQR